LALIFYDFKRFYILIHPEEAIRVVFVFNGYKPLIIVPIGL